MPKNKIKEIPFKMISYNFPNTKTVWGLTKEEIEFCAYLFQGLALLILVIGFIYVVIALKEWISDGEGEDFSITLGLFIFSIIPMGIGVYGINYENKIVLIVFFIFDIFTLIVYLFATINWRFLVIGAVLIDTILILQLILVVMFIMCLFAHNEIFKKEIFDWMDKPLNHVLSISDDPSEIVYDSNPDGKTKDNKQKDAPEKDNIQKNSLEKDLKTNGEPNQTNGTQTEDNKTEKQ